MTEVFFYHLQRQPLEKVLPVLLLKCREREWNVVVRAGSPERVSALDDLLWTFADESFLPHGVANDANAARQPIVLTTDETASNSPHVAITVDGTDQPAIDNLQRIMVVFDGNDADALQRAREQYKHLREQGHALSYWQQNDNGSWQEKG
jgi:DNA polymerase III subunit chi